MGPAERDPAAPLPLGASSDATLVSGLNSAHYNLGRLRHGFGPLVSELDEGVGPGCGVGALHCEHLIEVDCFTLPVSDLVQRDQLAITTSI